MLSRRQLRRFGLQKLFPFFQKGAETRSGAGGRGGAQIIVMAQRGQATATQRTHFGVLQKEIGNFPRTTQLHPI